MEVGGDTPQQRRPEKDAANDLSDDRGLPDGTEGPREQSANDDYRGERQQDVQKHVGGKWRHRSGAPRNYRRGRRTQRLTVSPDREKRENAAHEDGRVDGTRPDAGNRRLAQHESKILTGEDY